MSQVSGFGNYSRNQFLFLSSNNSNLKKEDNPQSTFDFKQDFNDDSVNFSSVVSFDDEEKLQDNEQKIVDTIDFSSNIFIDEVSYDEELLMQNNPFMQEEPQEDSIEKFSKVFLDEENEDKRDGVFQFDF